ncbi:MAG: ferredoxin family protein [Ferruginibacter sp.]|nr:ferredoxin family protein [Cytophagales bacterium]
MKNETDCKHQPRVLMPRVNLSKCEGKTPCVKVCPYGVFEIRDLTKEEYGSLTWVGKVKTWVRGSAKAYAVRADQCHACGLCVAACPEKAISLVRYAEG